MTASARGLILQWTEHERLLLKGTLAFAGIYVLMAYALECIQIVLGRGWFDIAWGLAQGAVVAAALTGGLSCQRELHTLQKRVTPVAHMHVAVQRIYQNLLVTSFVGLGYLVLISHLPVDASEIVSSPWTLPAFVWFGAPLYLLAAMAWHQAWPGLIKAAIWLLAIAYVAVHKTVALAWGVHQGAWLVWGLLVGGAAGLSYIRHALLKTGAVSWRSGPLWWQWWRLWSQHWSERAPLLHPRMTWIVPALSSQWVGRFIHHPDFPVSLVSNYFWSSRVVFLTCWMFALLRSERAHWRWQMLPGSGFRKQLGMEIAQCTGRYMVMDLVIVVTLIAVLWWFWAPYGLVDVIHTVQLLTWPLLVDFTWALACAVWLRSMHWRSVLDMTALLGLLWVLWMAVDPRFWGARSWLQDGLMLCTVWLMVQRANKNFETSNWSWLTKGRHSGWWGKPKGS